MSPSRDRNFLLGLSALAGTGDPHYGAGIIALERLMTLAGIAPEEQKRLDGLIEHYTSRIKPVKMLSNPDISTGEAAESIALAISEVCSNLHYIAHDLIVGASALIALDSLRGKVDGRIVENIVGMLSGYQSAPPGIFQNLDVKEIRARERVFVDFDIGIDENGIIRKMISVLQSIKRTGLGFGFRAQEFHVVTHTHALIWLKRNGHPGIFRIALKPWFFRMNLLDGIGNPDQIGFVQAPFSDIRFGSETFWDRIDMLGEDPHVFKTAFSILELQRYGLLSEEDFEWLWKAKMPFWFSP